MRYLIRDAATGYHVPSIPQYRTYATERDAKRAAQRAADSLGTAVAYGHDAPGFYSYLKVTCGICQPRNMEK
jgi:hypothetical protein